MKEHTDKVKPYSIKVIEVPSVNSNQGKINILSDKHEYILVRASCEFSGSTQFLQGQIESSKDVISKFKLDDDHSWLMNQPRQANGLKLDFSGSEYVEQLGTALKITVIDLKNSIPEGDFDLFQIYSEKDYPYDPFEKIVVLGATRLFEEKQYYVRECLWGKPEDGIIINSKGQPEFQFNQPL